MKFDLSPDEQTKIEVLASPEVRKPKISIEELEALCDGDEELLELFHAMIKSCLDYTITVARWQQERNNSGGYGTEELKDADLLRGSTHDRTIADINLFGRSLGRFGKDNRWMDEDGMDGRNRAAYGKFALILTLSRLK